MKFILIIIWIASTIDLSSNLSVAGVRLTGVLWGVVSICVVLRMLQTYSLDRIPTATLRHNALFLLAFVYYAARCNTSNSFLYAVADLQSLFLPLMIGMLTYDAVETPEQLSRIEKNILSSIAVPVALLGLGLVTGLSFFVEGVGQKGFIGARSVSLYGVPVLAIALGVLVYEKENPARKRLAMIATGICFVSIVVTLSRTALLASFVMLLVVGCLTMNLKNLIKCIAGMALVIILALQWAPMAERLMPKEADTLADVAQSGEFTSGRALLWTFVFQEGMQRPLMGAGTGNVKNLIESNMRSSGILPHNEYLRLFYDGGVIGLLIIFIALVCRLKRHLKYWREASRTSNCHLATWNLSAFLATLAMIVSAFFDNVFLYQFMLCILFIIYGVADKISENGLQKELLVKSY